MSWPRRLRAKVTSSMGVEPKKTSKPIGKLLDAASLDLDAATRLLAEPPNVLAANHLQQAAEKILAAVRLHRGLINTRDHDLVILIDGRPAVNHAHFPLGPMARAAPAIRAALCVRDGLSRQPQPASERQRPSSDARELELVARDRPCRTALQVAAPAFGGQRA